MNVKKLIGQVLKTGVLISTLGLILAVSVQIFARFLLESAPSWTEEASRIFFIYAVSFGAGLAVESDEYVYLDTFYQQFSSSLQRFLRLMTPVLTFLLFVIILIYCIPVIQLGATEKSPSMGLNMAIPFFGLIILTASICYYSWNKFKSEFQNKNS